MCALACVVGATILDAELCHDGGISVLVYAVIFPAMTTLLTLSVLRVTFSWDDVYFAGTFQRLSPGAVSRRKRMVTGKRDLIGMYCQVRYSVSLLLLIVNLLESTSYT
jgi:hypothetical protein